MFVQKLRKFVLLFLLCIFGCAGLAQDQVVFTISKVPVYTPASDTIYLTGTFNNWTLGDSTYRFRKMPDNTYRLAISLHNTSAFEFKINRGNWSTVEGNDVGGLLNNHEFNYSDSVFEYLLEVKSWQDLHKEYFPPTHVKVTSLPDNTPLDAKIYISGSFNGWNSADAEFELRRAPDGTYSTEINSGLAGFTYKFTRGTWQTAEARWDGGTLRNRIHVTKPGTPPVIVTEIATWRDLSQGLLLWKIVFSFLIVQLVLIFVFLYKRKKSRLVALPFLILCLVFSLLFAHSHYSLSTLFVKSTLVSAASIGLWGLLAYHWLKEHYALKYRKWEYAYLLSIPPVLLMLFLATISNDEFTFWIVDGVASKYILGAYGYAALVNLFFWRRLRRMLGHIEHKASEFVLVFFRAFGVLVYIAVGLLGCASIALWWLGDWVMVVDWLENLTWSALGALIVLAQYMALNEAYFGLPIAPAQLTADKPTLPDKQWQALKEKLQVLMEEKLLYSNPKLSLAELARQLGTNTFYVSKVINEGFEKSFTDYVNSYRIKAIIEELNNSPRDTTFLYVALKMGFNSKSAFNRAFKKHTSQTPSAYFGRED